MKKGIPVLIVFLLLSNFVISQVKPFRFGFRMAPNLAWFSSDADKYESDGATAGFSWGFVSDITLTENYFVKTGFNVDYLNGKLTFPYEMIIDPDTISSTGELSRKFNLRNLQIPATIKMRTNRFGKFAFFGNIGFGVSFNLKAKSNDAFTYGDETTEFETKDISDKIKFAKASIIVGCGLEYFFDNSTSLFLELNYNNGLTNILKGNNIVYPDIKQKAFMDYLELNIGILF